MAAMAATPLPDRAAPCYVPAPDRCFFRRNRPMPFHLLRHRAFALLLGGRLLTTIATNAQAAAIGWQVYAIARLTRGVEESALMVGMVGLAQFAPLFLLALPAGETADRYDRRRILLVCLALQLCCSGALAWLAHQPDPTLTPLFIIAGLFGVARSFVQPATTALAPTLVPVSALPQAVALNTLSAQTGMVLGPWLGGLLCAIDVFWAYAMAGGLFAIAGLAILRMLFMNLPGARGLGVVGSRLAMICEGLAYVRANKLVLGAVSLDLFAVLLGGATALLPIFAKDILHVGPEGLGVLRSAPAVGALAAGLVLSHFALERRVGRKLLVAVAVFGLSMVVFGLSTSFWLSLLALAISGAADMVSVVVRQTLVQLETPDPMRGRVAAVNTLFIGASNQLGEFESGVTAAAVGPVGSVVLGGLGTIGISLAWWRLFRPLAERDTLAGPARH